MDCFRSLFFGVESFPGGCIFRLFVGFFHTSSDKGQGGALVGSLEVDTPLHDVY